MMTKSKKLLFLSGVLLISFFVFPKVSSYIFLQIEKHSLKPPPKYKTLAEVKGIQTVNLASVSGKIKYPHDFTLVLLGDSMTEILGNADELKGYLNEYYPNKAFEVLNYGFGSTNIMSVYARLTKNVFYHREFRPVLDIDFDMILIESMGHNPLSDFPLGEGLKKQTEALDQIVGVIREKNPGAKIIFVATVAPNKETYAKGSVFKLTDKERVQWIEDRDAYIQNHIDYAMQRNIPVVDIYHRSMDSSGSGKSIYINTTDHIHPSPTGVLLISKEIADFIAKNKLLPAKVQ